ncbi:MAG: Pycsar system effector family protein [Arenicella sp.]
MTIVKDKKSGALIDEHLLDQMGISKSELKALKKKLAKIAPRSERGVETLFRLLSKNQYTLNTMVDSKSNILITINALILSIIIGTVLNQLGKDPHLIYPAVMMLATNLLSIAYAVFATRPELLHGDKATDNLLFYGNFSEMQEQDYVDRLDELMHEGDELYRAISRDTFYLGREIDRKFRLIRTSFTVFLTGIVFSVAAFIICHIFF